MRKIEWEEIARRGRNHSVLCMDLIARGISGGCFSKLYGGEARITRWRQFASARWMDAREVAGLIDFLKMRLSEDPIYLLKKARDAEAIVSRTFKLAERVSRIYVRQLRNARLLKLLDEIALCYGDLAGPTYSYVVINKFYPDYITEIVGKRQKEPHKQSEMLKRLLAIERGYSLKLERAGLAALAKKHSEGTLSDAEIATHAREFGHLGRYVFYGQPYDARILRQRISQLLEKGVDEELRQLAENDNYVQEARELEKRWKLTPDELIRLETIREWIWFSYYNDEVWGLVAHRAMNLWEEIAKRLWLAYDELVELTYPEIVSGLKSERKFDAAFRERIAERYKDSAIVAVDGKVELLEGERLKNYYKEERKAEVNYSHITEVGGTPASPGKASGRAVVLHSITELDRVRKGDILIAASTVPAFVPAMERAAAIVTNEGGLLSHAAIVSREFRKPCIVGTKIATKVFKTGDLVEVDAIKGVVRKLQQRE